MKASGCCITSVEASTCSAWKRWKLLWKQWKASIFYGIGSLRGCLLWKLPWKCFQWKLPWKLPLAPLRKIQMSCVHFHGLPRGITKFHSRPLRRMNFDVPALLPLASVRFHVLPKNCMPFFCLPWRKGNRLNLARKEVNWRHPPKEIGFEAPTEKIAISGKFHCRTRSLQWAVLASTTGLYPFFLCICTCFSMGFNELCYTSTY